MRGEEEAMSKAFNLFFILLIIGTILLPASGMSEQNFRIAYTVFSREEKSDIFVMDSDGGNVERLTHGHEVSAFPSWSPDGERIAFDTNRDGNFEIYVINADGSNPQSLTKTPFVEERYPSWSPDGKKIAYGDMAGGRRLFAMDLDTGNSILIPCVSGKCPAWSSDGRKIVFKSLSAMQEIYITDADGRNWGNCARLTSSYAHDSRPSWSPDGKSIIFSAFPAVNVTDFEILRFNIGSGNIEQLTDSPKWDVDPCWSPDGEKIAFASDRDGQFDIYVMDASGGDVTRLTETLWDERHPVWSPPLPMAVTSAGKMAVSWVRIKSGK